MPLFLNIFPFGLGSPGNLASPPRQRQGLDGHSTCQPVPLWHQRESEACVMPPTERVFFWGCWGSGGPYLSTNQLLLRSCPKSLSLALGSEAPLSIFSGQVQHAAPSSQAMPKPTKSYRWLSSCKLPGMDREHSSYLQAQRGSSLSVPTKSITPC